MTHAQILAEYRQISRQLKRLKEKLRPQIAEKKRALKRSTKQIRAAVMLRAGGRCEYCGREASPFNPLQFHHEKPGNGRRRQQQSVDNCKAVHASCHRRWHDGERDFS